MTDKELITRIVVHNDTEAFAVVMQRYSGLVFSTALSITKDYELAKEVMQLALIKAYQNLHHWRSGTSLAPYLQMITHNQALDTLKNRQKERHNDIDSVSIIDEDNTKEHHRLLEKMDSAITKLPDDERKIIEMHYYQKLKTKEIAELTGQSESNILVRLHRIRAKLKKLIENDKVEAIIILPRELFITTDISVTLWILAGNRKARTVEQNGKMVKYRYRENEVLFVDLRQWGEPFEKKYIQFSPEQIADIARNIHNWQREGYETTYQNIPEYCYSASLDEIERKGWSLVPSKYIEFKNLDEGIDFDARMRELQSEMRELLVQEEESKKELTNLFKSLGYDINL